MSYQGQLSTNGTPFDGPAQFKFVIFDNDDISLWSNDGTSVNASEPQASVTLMVDDGLFSTLLGAPPMVPLTANLLENVEGGIDPMLIVWVNTGAGFERLSDQPLASSAFALRSESADGSLGPFTASGIIHSTVGGFRFPDNSVQTTAAAGGGGGGTLDQAYDHGGPGAGRTITADAGAVNVQGPDGLTVNGSLGVGAQTRVGRLSIASIGGNDTTKILAFDESPSGSEFFLESGFSGAGNNNHLKLKTAFTTIPSMTWRGDGKVALGTINATGRLTVEHPSLGANDPAFFVKNTNPQGQAIFADANSVEPTMVLQNHGGGDYLSCYVSNPATPAFRVTQFGKATASFLEVNGGGPFTLDANGHMKFTGLFGGSLNGAPLWVENTSASGVALVASVSSTNSTTALFANNGTGSLIAGTQNGVLKFHVDNGGRIRQVGNYGGGVGGAPVYAENTASNGVAFWGKAVGSDATCVLEQNGTGSLLKAFQNGQLKFEVQNSGRVVTPVLEITGGADLAEPFAMADVESARPGTVLVIDELEPGQLRVSDRAYDTRVAGIVSGAGGVNPGITLRQEELRDGKNVALSGRVYALADATNGAIRPGDLLTTSDVPGHAMKVTDPLRGPGAVIGKAMSTLDGGRGLVLVLVSLQ
jgi:hypothetical protein